jgi:hypothetical protein
MAGKADPRYLWRVYCGDELVGEIHNCGYWDMFWTSGEFHPRGRFEQDFRACFEDYRSGDADRRTAALRMIRESLHLVDSRGHAHPIFSLVVEGGHARFRLMRT